MTLPSGFPHKRADRDPFEKGFRGLYVSTAFVSPRVSRVRRNAVETGECPEWQRELTVNQPPHGFEGSSPSSPTNYFRYLRIWYRGLLFAGQGYVSRVSVKGLERRQAR